MSIKDKMVDGYLPKEHFGDGPWQDEPDRVEWRHAGLACLVNRNHMGVWCGYVAVPPRHPLHGVGYNSCTKGCDETFCDDRVDSNLEVHGGLTYSAFCQEGRESNGICHVPRPGEPANVWWFGFDCGHAFDFVPGIEATMEAIYAEKGEARPGRALADLPAWAQETYKTLAYVTAETNSLAEQLASVR